MSKYILYGSLFCPFTRKVKFFLDEKGIDHQITDVKFWLRNKDFIKLNPANEVPVFKNLETKEVICDSYLICDYINDIENNSNEINYFNFLGNGTKDKYEIQRLHMWFDKKFYNEITKYIIEEIFLKTYQNNDMVINTDKINIATANLEMHLKYAIYLLSKRKWLACESFSVADIALATQLSVIDYLGYINWDKYLKLKEWYATIKSKKGFRGILFDKIPGFKASKNYDQLDF